MKKALLLCLVALSIVMASLVSCKGDVDTDGKQSIVTQDTSAVPGESTQTDDGSGSALPSDLNFGNKEINILYWSDVINKEFEINEISGNIIEDAVFEKDSCVQDKLGVVFKWNGQPGSKKNLQPFMKYVKNNFSSGDKNIDIIAVHSMTMGALAAAGLMHNLSDTKYLDFEKPWWPEDLIKNSTINNKLYFASGDISLNTLLGMIGMFYNKDMAQHNLYDYVRNGTWTFDKMLEETENVYEDLNGDGISDGNDKYGYVTYSGMVNPLFCGMGIRFVDTSSGEIEISPTYVSEKTQGLLQKVVANYYENRDWHYFPQIGNCTDVFVNGNSLFYMASVRLTVNSLAGAQNLKYGILPNPKYDEAQDDYKTLMANTYTMYGICKTVDDCDIDMYSAVIESMAEESFRTVTPAVFESALKARYSEAPDDSEMFDRLRKTSVMEIGLIFSDQIGGIPSKGLFTCVNNHSADWMSFMKSQSKSMENYLRILNASFEE